MINLKNIPTFGIAGNFTGHLEQAGESKDFINVKTKEQKAPKAIFPTYIPTDCKIAEIPEYLQTFPFDDSKIIFPSNEKNIQIEPECGIIFDLTYKDNKVSEIKPVCFGSSNDCSIRKEGAKKISEKKNWGKSSKGFSSHLIPLENLDENCILDNYRIASFLKRGNTVYEYGENSAVKDYSYFHATLTEWIIEKLNNQICEGPAENIYSYLEKINFPTRIMISIGATRYTEFGEHNYLQKDDKTFIVLYPETKYSKEDIFLKVESEHFEEDDISILVQTVVL